MTLKEAEPTLNFGVHRDGSLPAKVHPGVLIQQTAVSENPVRTVPDLRFQQQDVAVFKQAAVLADLTELQVKPGWTGVDLASRQTQVLQKEPQTVAAPWTLVERTFAPAIRPQAMPDVGFKKLEFLNLGMMPKVELQPAAVYKGNLTEQALFGAEEPQETMAVKNPFIERASLEVLPNMATELVQAAKTQSIAPQTILAERVQIGTALPAGLVGMMETGKYGLMANVPIPKKQTALIQAAPFFLREPVVLQRETMVNIAQTGVLSST